MRDGKKEFTVEKTIKSTEIGAEISPQSELDEPEIAELEATYAALTVERAIDIAGSLSTRRGHSPIDYLEQELDDLCYATVRAVNGQDTLLKAKAESPDLILLDIMMPVLDGFAVLSCMKADSTL